ncbi:hypothetical protein pb186bvf_010507 [Paramecium bursaria]
MTPLAISYYPMLDRDTSQDDESIKEIKQQGDLLLQSLQFEQAHDIYQQALPLLFQQSCPPQFQQISEEILLKLAKCSLELRQYLQCRNYSFEIVKLNPQSEAANLFLALSYQQLGNKQKAVQYITQAKTLCPPRSIYQRDIDQKFWEIKLKPYVIDLGITLTLGSFAAFEISRKNSQVLYLSWIGCLCAAGYQQNKILKYLCWGSFITTIIFKSLKH